MPDLAKKLGIKTGHSVCLLNAPSNGEALLKQECPEGVHFSETPKGQRYDIITFWPRQLDGLADRFAQLQHHITPEGAVWAVMPKKQYARARGIAFSWQEMQEAALQTDLVDNKEASLSEEEYATRFVIRKHLRSKYT